MVAKSEIPTKILQILEEREMTNVDLASFFPEVSIKTVMRHILNLRQASKIYVKGLSYAKTKALHLYAVGNLPDVTSESKTPKQLRQEWYARVKADPERLLAMKRRKMELQQERQERKELTANIGFDPLTFWIPRKAKNEEKNEEIHA